VVIIYKPESSVFEPVYQFIILVVIKCILLLLHSIYLMVNHIRYVYFPNKSIRLQLLPLLQNEVG